MVNAWVKTNFIQDEYVCVDRSAEKMVSDFERMFGVKYMSPLVKRLHCG